MENYNQAFKAVTRIVLNNWHYIDAKVLDTRSRVSTFLPDIPEAASPR